MPGNGFSHLLEITGDLSFVFRVGVAGKMFAFAFYDDDSGHGLLVLAVLDNEVREDSVFPKALNGEVFLPDFVLVPPQNFWMPIDDEGNFGFVLVEAGAFGVFKQRLGHVCIIRVAQFPHRPNLDARRNLKTTFDAFEIKT